MVRETRHLWVGNLPDNIREDRIREHFKRYGRVQSVKLLPRSTKEETGEGAMACTVAFMDIKSASKAHTSEHKIDDRTLTTEYYEPAAIPSSASPQNTPSSYSTSPGSTRFPNGHGSTEEHGAFNDRFYDRTNSRVPDPDFTRRTGYHDNNRGRTRDRGYRNGPYNNVVERPHRSINSWTSYDSTRYNSQANETGYSSTPTETNERRTSESTKKKTKSRSGSRTPSPGSASSRSPSRSGSRSSSSSSSSSTSRATSSTGSPKSRRLGSHQPVVHSEDRRPLAICVRNLPLRSSDTSLKDGLFHEYKKHGKVTWVKVVGQSSERHAIVCFKKPEDVEKALEVSYDKMFFGSKIEVAPYQGYDVDDNDLRPYEAEIDEFHPKATRTLFIGNLEKDITASDLRKHFDQFGEIIEIDIKKQGAVSSYAFCQYSDIVSVVKAIRSMDGEHLGNNRIKLGFGKSMPTNCVWVDGVTEGVTEKYLMMQFDPFGSITQVIIDREKGQALIFYDQALCAQSAVIKMRGAPLRGRKMQVDFASRECQEAFYEHLEKQGHVLDKSNFEERRDSRDSTSRTFENATLSSTARFTARYETPTRPRTSSYSSRTGASTGQCNTSAAIPSPGTPGSGTPRGSSSRSRLTRYPEYYEQGGVEYAERHFRSYDEFSQGSAASHEDFYEHEYPYNHDSPTHLELLESRTAMVSPTAEAVVAKTNVMVRLQKERIHLLDSLDDGPSSGDEMIGSKKRLKVDHLESANDVIIEANRDHRKVMEVRRLSDVSLKHHSRRPSIDSKHSRDATAHERTSYVPHGICKRRKTAGSDSGSRIHHYDHSGSESIGGSRPGTPLCDERPEHFTPSEPRRIPREREGPLTLPLPKFAAHVMNRGSVSVAGIKGQKDNVLASPPAAVTSPRISNPKPPSPVQVPPPASPPPRPPSLSSNSSDSDIAPPSPSLDERIKSLDEKYEKWSGSRALSAAGNDALAKLDANSQRFRFRHKLLDLDLKELQPSEIVKSVMAKRSVFDEDSKRLENVGEKYEPREFNVFPRSTTVVQTTVPAVSLPTSQPLKISAAVQLPKTPTMLSPRSTGTTIPAAKGLQYPFPTHPPVQPTVAASTPPAPTATLLTPASSSTTTRGSHGDNRLKPFASVSSDNRTSSKVSVNRTASNSSLVSNLTQTKTVDSCKSGGVIPSGNCDAASGSDIKQGVGVKTVDKHSDKVVSRRDSTTSNSASPRGDVKTRRNSDTCGRKLDDSSESHDYSASERLKNEEWRREQQRLEKIRTENEKLEKERLEKERLEKERLEKERAERERLEKEKEVERLEKEKQEKERIEKEKAEKERLERERLEREKRRERDERERREREERERREAEEQLEKERRERREREERMKRDTEERERREREEKERKEREEKERREREEKEKKEKERAEEDRTDKEKVEKEKERKREKEEERKHKDDNHDKRKEEHSRHRENHSENKHRENNVDFRSDKHSHDTKNTKENRDSQELNKKDSHESRNCHDSKESKSRHHTDRESEKRKELSKENSLHEKSRNCINEIREYKDRPSIESRHMSLDMDKSRHNETNTSSNKSEAHKKKERNNSLPASIGSKRRISSHDSLDNPEACKRIKLSSDHKKQSERRDSKDSNRSDEKLSSKVKHTHKNSSSKTHDDKQRTEKANSIKDGGDERRKEKEREDRHRHKHTKLDKQKVKKNREKEPTETNATTPVTPPAKDAADKDFLVGLDLQANEENEKLKQQRKEIKEKRKENSECVEHKDDNKQRSEEKRKERHSSGEKKIRDEKIRDEKIREEKIREGQPIKSSDDSNKSQKKERIRKLTQTSSDNNSDSDGTRKHSIFEVEEEPTYISMYDKVKARSCKNMLKCDEERRQEEIKAKFCQLKQCRARREEKKRSTSWDEDSDSDHERHDIRIRKAHRMLLITSSDEDDDRIIHFKPRKREIYIDSDQSSQSRLLIKQDSNDNSDNDRIITVKNIRRKGSRSRIASDTSDDEYSKVKAIIKSESYFDIESENNFADTEEKPYRKVKEESAEKLIKKERRINKHHESLEQINAHIFGDSNSPVPDIKQEKFNSGHSCLENSSADESMDVKKDKAEARKRHKKKQRRPKPADEDDDLTSKIDAAMEMLHSDGERMLHLERKKEHSKKEKKKDRIKDEIRLKERSKKAKKNKELLLANIIKHDGKMENIFGPLSEDSDNGLKDQDHEDENTDNQIYFNRYSDENLHAPAYVSDSDSLSHERELLKAEEKERILREEHRRRKEKRRREKERRLREELNNENSMDYADMGKLLEENIKDDTATVVEELKESTESEKGVREKLDVTRTFNDRLEQELSKEVRKELREKKKKRKKSKEERQSRHHHSHHHDKTKIKSPEIKKESATEEETLPTTTSVETPPPPPPPPPPSSPPPQPPAPPPATTTTAAAGSAEVVENKDNQIQSLPTTPDIPSSPLNKSSDYSISPIRTHDPLISPIPKTPSSNKEKKRDKLFPGFGKDIDEKIHENAVKSIPEFEIPKEDVKPVANEEVKPEKLTESNDEKPRVVISQEETEDAVAALLGESFGENQFSNCYDDDDLSQSNEQVTNVAEDENIQQDDEEMRQAVQSLNTTADIEIKPDTPQSDENDLQIDTDTEEQEDIVVPTVRYEQSPRTPDMVDLSHPPKTPDIPLYYRGDEQVKPTTIILKTTNIGSPPSLTPIKPHATVVMEAKRNLDSALQITKSPSMPSLPSLQSSAKEETNVSKTETKTPAVSTIVTVQAQNMATQLPTTVSCTVRTYSAPALVKVSEPACPSLTAISKPEGCVVVSSQDSSKAPHTVTTSTTNSKSPIPPLMHNLPARPPYPQPTQQKVTTSATEAPTLTRVTASNIQFNRLPITPIMVSKPLQSTTVLLPQPKNVHSLEPPKLVSTAEPRQQQDRTRVAYQNAVNLPQLSGYVPTQPRIILQTAAPGQRTIPSQGLLVQAKKLPTSNYPSYLPNIVSTVNYSLPKISKDTSPNSDKVVTTEPPKLLPTSVPVTYSHSVSQSSNIISQSLTSKTHAIIITSHPNIKPTVSASTDEARTFTPVIQETAKALSMTSSNPPEVSAPHHTVIHVESSKSSVTPSPSPPVLVTIKKDLDKPEVKLYEEEKKSPLPVGVVTTASSAGPPLPVKSDTPLPATDVSSTQAEQCNRAQTAVEKVTEELNISLKKEEPEAKAETEIKPDQKREKEEVVVKVEKSDKADENITVAKVESGSSETPLSKTDNIQTPVEPSKSEAEVEQVSKETDKFDEEKADTESVLSDTSKERSSAELLNKDDAADSKEDSDYWSAKDVNIDSVIKTLCSADELSDRSSEAGKDEWLDQENKLDEKKDSDTSKTDDQENKEGPSSTDTSRVEDESYEEVSENVDDKELSAKSRRAGRGRGRKTKTERAGVQTRRGKTGNKETPKRTSRTSKAKTERKISKSESEASADIYEFRDDSDENNTNKDRPRLILTIKSPALASNGGANNQTAIVKEVVKEQLPLQQKPPENKDEFASPVSNTRKSRRLQERDVSRNTVDDTIEDVVRNTAVVTRAASAAAAQTPRRSARQTATKAVQETPRKSPRSRKKDRRGSETTDDSSEEKSVKNEPVVKPDIVIPKEKENIKECVKETKPEPVREKPHEGLKATVLRRVKGEMNQEPMTLIDPVTGLLTPMRECEEGRYIPVPGTQDHRQGKPAEITQPSVITAPQTPIAPKQQKPQSFKQHVLSSEAAKAVVSQQQQQQQQQHQQQQQQQQQKQQSQPQQHPHTAAYPVKPFPPKQTSPINQNLNVNVSLPSYVPTHVSPRSVSHTASKPSHAMPVVAAKASHPPPPTVNQVAAFVNQKQLLQQAAVAANQPTVPKAHLVSSQPQVINTQVAHVKAQPQFMKQQQMVVNKTPLPKTPLQAHQQIITGSMASPPLKGSQQVVVGPNSRIIQSHLQSKGAMEPPKVEVSLGNCVMVPRPNISPQGQTRHVLQAGMPVPAYEASLLGERSVYNRSRSPPPAHQISPSPQGEAMAHFPPVPLRPPHDLHYMHHPHNVMYQQYLRQSYHLPRSVTGGLEKPGDGQEGEEAPVTSPPLELRRPGSVGLALSGHSAAVPHALHSPHDRATDSPQVGQVYSLHTARMPHYHTSRFYEPAEPPPAHRPQTSHSSLAALGSDRPLGHLGPLGTPDRPLSSHSALAAHMGGLAATERALTTHLPPDRPLSSHSLGLGAGLGAAGNLMGAVARHVGADAPATQRGLQAATPPHASQVPPQAESLLMLLKQYPCMWQGLLALKNDQAAVQMYFVSGNESVAKFSLPKNIDGSTPPLRIFQRMRLEPPQVEGVARKMQMENEHCMLLALPCGHDHMDVLKQSTNLTNGFITYLQQKQAAGIVNVAAPGTTQPPAYVVHIFPSCDFVNENLRRIAPSLLERVADIAHLLIVITTV